MNDPNWIIAGASVLNVLVLVAYAVFTKGIWTETRLSATRTENLVEQSRDALKVQIVATLFQLREAASARADTNRRYAQLASMRTGELRELLEKVIPGLWKELEPLIFPALKETEP